METLKDIFVSYDIAAQLKKIGFNEPCIAFYDIDNNLSTIIRKQATFLEEYEKGTFTTSNYSGMVCPSYEQVFDWFRKKNFYFSIFHSYEESESWYNVIHLELDFYKNVDLKDKDSDGHYYYDISGSFNGDLKEVREKMVYTAIKMYENFIHKKNFLKNGKKTQIS